MDSAIVIIDMQKYFHQRENELFTKKVIPNLKNLLSFARLKKIKVIHVKTIYSKDKSNWPNSFLADDSIWCIENTNESEFIDEVKPLENEIIIIKKRYSGFFETDLKDILTTNNIDTLFFAGYSSDVCVRFTTMDAYNFGYKIFWLIDCMDSCFENFLTSIEYIKKLTKLNTCNNNEFKYLFKNK